MIEAGHTPAAVEEYTLAQVEFYGAAIDRARRRKQRELAIILRAATKYESADFEEFVKD